MPSSSPSERPRWTIELQDVSLLNTVAKQPTRPRYIPVDNGKHVGSTAGYEPEELFECHNDEPFGDRTFPCITSERSRAQIKPSNWERITHPHGCRSGTSLCVGLSLTVLLINIIFTIVASAKFGIRSGVGTFYYGSCKTVNNWSTGIHILINILSSLLLGASNYVMQTISAPTRHELDAAHAKADWLDVGVLSFRNLFGRISIQRTLLYSLLAFSSLPLHLLYNSAVFKLTTSSAYAVGIVPPDFATRPILFNNSDPRSAMAASILEFFSHSASNNTLVAKLQNSDCIAAYGTEFISTRSDVLLISNCPEAYSEASLGLFRLATWEPGSQEFEWICGSEPDFQRPGTYQETCQTKKLQKMANGWTVGGCKVDFCLSKLEEVKCKLQFSLFVLLTVILCNIMKSAVMVWSLIRYNKDSLLTIGDAIGSYLTDPDLTSIGSCLASKAHLEHDRRSRTSFIRHPPTEFCQTGSRRWASAVSVKRWCTALGPCFLTLILAAYLLHVGLTDDANASSLQHPFKRAFGQLDGDEVMNFGNDTGFVTAVLIANMPQMIVSFLYVSYNGVWTTMLLASEWDHFYLRSKPLRVTSPRGEQRSTYWLQLPFTYSLPLLTAMIILHWLISESLFAAQVEVQDDSSVQIQYQNYNGYSDVGTLSFIAYSTQPILLSILLGFLMVVAVVAASFRKFTSPMPLASSCSLAIAAACHPPSNDENAAYFPVSWGAVDSEDHDVGHCCFTTHPVHPLVPGKLYAGPNTQMPQCTNTRRLLIEQEEVQV